MRGEHDARGGFRRGLALVIEYCHICQTCATCWCVRDHLLELGRAQSLATHVCSHSSTFCACAPRVDSECVALDLRFLKSSERRLRQHLPPPPGPARSLVWGACLRQPVRSQCEIGMTRKVGWSFDHQKCACLQIHQVPSPSGRLRGSTSFPSLPTFGAGRTLERLQQPDPWLGDAQRKTTGTVCETLPGKNRAARGGDTSGQTHVSSETHGVLWLPWGGCSAEFG